MLWKGHCLHCKLEGGCCQAENFQELLFHFSIYLIFASFCAHIQLLCMFVFWDAEHVAVCRSKGDGVCAWRFWWEGFSRCWGVSMPWVCATNTLVQFLLGCAACWMIELISEYKSLFYPQTPWGERAMVQFQHGTWLEITVITAGSLMIIISLGLSYHLLHFLLAIGLVDKR